MRALGALAIVWSGCSVDVCAPFDGHSCVALELHGDSALSIDRLSIGIDGVLAEQLSPQDAPRDPPVHLPIAVAVLPGDAAFVPLSINVRALLHGLTQAQAETPVLSLATGEHRSLTLDLIGNTPDSGADLRSFDLRPLRDLAEPSDLADAAVDFGVPDLNPSDLNLPDLLAVDLIPPFCQSISVTTLAGDGTSAFLDAVGTNAHFSQPTGVAIDVSGNVYVADTNNQRIRKIAPGGSTTTLAGNGTAGFFDGTGGAAGTTMFKTPLGISVDGAGNVYVGDFMNNRVRKVASNGSTTTLAGNGGGASTDGTGGPAGTAQFFSPWGVAVDSTTGIVFVGEHNGHRIRKLAANGDTTTLAGSGAAGFFDGTGGPSGTTQFNFPTNVALDGSGNVFVADYIGNRARKVASDGTTTTLAGNSMGGTTDGTGGPFGTTEFNGPVGIARDADGFVYIGEQNTSRIRRIATDGSTITVTGSVGSGFQDGSGCIARFNSVQGIAVIGKQLVVADQTNNRIRIVQLP